MEFRDKDNVIYSFCAQHPPVAELTPGEIIVIETADCFNGQIHESGQSLDTIDMEQVNPATGPFFVRGAEPGDVLEIDILDINISGRGIMVVKPALGVLGDEVSTAVVKVVNLTETHVSLAQGVTVPVQPMLGVIGVAPDHGEEGCGNPGFHGGNLDCKEICPGNKVYLPVFHAGALLALGDVHALMGDGEISGTGVETSAEVRIRVLVNKELSLAAPRVETNDGIFFLSSAYKLEDAIQAACREGVSFLQKTLDISFSEANMVAGAAGQLRFSQVVNPLFTVKFFIPWLATGLKK